MRNVNFVILSFILFICPITINGQDKNNYSLGDHHTSYGIRLNNFKDGSYELTIKDGKASIIPLIWLNPDTPIPTPDPTPTPDLSERAKEIKKQVENVNDQNRPETSAMLAELYRRTIDLIKKEELKGSQMISLFLQMSTDNLLEQRGVKSQWENVRSSISGYFTTIVQDGGGDNEIIELLRDAEYALDSSYQQNVNIDIAAILKIIQLVMEWINRIFPQ